MHVFFMEKNVPRLLGGIMYISPVYLSVCLITELRNWKDNMNGNEEQQHYSHILVCVFIILTL